jgi:hypothetical protein
VSDEPAASLTANARDADLQKRADDTRKLLIFHKRRVSEQLVNDGEAATSELAQITKLEIALRNIETVLRLRAMTRRGGRSPAAAAEIEELEQEVKRAERSAARWRGRAKRAEAKAG